MMKPHGFVLLGALALLPGYAVASGESAGAEATTVRGQYVEARSASVYAGGCHYNGEVTTVGREALLAWQFEQGKLGGVSVDGLGAVALIAGADNLAEKGVSRRSVLLVDERATPEQRQAIAKYLQTKVLSLGTVAAVKSAPVRFASQGSRLTVSAGNASLSAVKYPCSHCVMPQQTWYAPFAPVQNAMVAQGENTAFKDATLGVSWSQTASDNVFFGTFAY